MAPRAENWPAHLVNDPEVLRLDPEGHFLVCRTCRTYQQVHGGRAPRPLRMTSRFSVRAWNVHKRRSMAHTRRDRAWRDLARNVWDERRVERSAARDSPPRATAPPVYPAVSVANAETSQQQVSESDALSSPASPRMDLLAIDRDQTTSQTRKTSGAMPAIVRMPQQPTEAARSYVALLEQEALDSESTDDSDGNDGESQSQQSFNGSAATTRDGASSEPSILDSIQELTAMVREMQRDQRVMFARISTLEQRQNELLERILACVPDSTH